MLYSDPFKVGMVYLGRKGGGATYSYEMCRVLLRKNIKIFAIVSENIESRDRWINLKQEGSLILYFLPTYTNRFEFIKSFFLSPGYKKCVKELKKWSPDVIYIPMLTLNAWKIVRHFNRDKIVTTIHDLIPHPGERNPIQTLIFNYIKRKSSRYIVLTDSFKCKVSECYGVDLNKVLVLPHAGFCFRRSDTPPDFDMIHFSILFFGRITPYKGLGVLLGAIDKIRDSIPEIKLTIAGEGELRSSETAMIKRNSDIITLINHWISEEEIAQLFEQSDFSLLPYTEASQSGVAAASFGAGRTVVASDVGGLKAQVEAGGGIVIEAGSSEELADAIIMLYKDPQIIIAKNKEAFAYFQNELTWDASASKLIDFLRN